MKTKKIPMRMCLGCREMKPKRELVRIVRNNQGQISLDKAGKAPGRGAYICPNPDCLNACIKTKALSRAFEAPVDEQVLDAIKEELVKVDEN